MKIPLVGGFVDERFLTHRLRSTSVAGIAGAALAGVLFLYRMFADDVREWDLFAVLAFVVLTKFVMLAYYFWKE
jgi:hypothetical protein